MFGKVELVENELYYYDSDAAEKPIRFIEKFARHYEGTKHAGKPFLLLPWQKAVVRALFGFKRRSDGLRRFRELYLISSKGAGKTPFIAAIGLYMLLGDGEPAAHVISMASTSEQARYTFDAAKKYISQHPDLLKVSNPTQHVIEGNKKLPKYAGSKWTTISGKPTGRSGSKPSCVIADECHEWSVVTSDAFELLTANCFKRSQPLVITATNAADNRSCYAWTVHERMVAIRNGEIRDDTVLPVIFEAPEEGPHWTSEDAARLANPSMPEVVTYEQLRPALTKALESREGETKYRRLYLSQWPKTSVRSWLDMPLWDAATQDFDPSTLKGAVFYGGLDLALCNDLSAAIACWCHENKIYVDSHFWMPRPVALEHAAKHRIPYEEWAANKFITLVDGPTIDSGARLEIASWMIAKAKGFKTQVIAYDRNRAEETVAILAAANVPHTPLAQGYTLTPGCEELDKRLLEKTIVIKPNPCLRWNATLSQVTPKDGKGNYWPVKPGATSSTSVGIRWMKIDGVVALVNALTEARKHAFPSARKMYNGGATGGVTITKPTVPTPPGIVRRT
jgi:phage terminase large subunit-like protein